MANRPISRPSDTTRLVEQIVVIARAIDFKPDSLDVTAENTTVGIGSPTREVNDSIVDDGARCRAIDPDGRWFRVQFDGSRDDLRFCNTIECSEFEGVVTFGLIAHIILKVPMTEWMVVVGHFAVRIAVVDSEPHVNPITGEGVLDLNLFNGALLVPAGQLIRGVDSSPCSIIRGASEVHGTLE